ncbi:UDP-glucose/GDP-mannose dehydrogenase family protein [Rhizobium cauense]|uniref:UDP-glucose dehydrogenase family protein n=1 Tax=Rhizobium cauense TaxID=1166683 RepID=UPI001C6F3110|nr:UDP-glucose/GDP-mannose dehydrogenase family protein [Rhizobium cauense]MBW9117362.1 UDP-glucose/GDP-mannose dehydrogenase family protein [Rhizobium cauense]
MNVVMIGAGYVGLTTGTCFASLGCNVCCVDLNEERIRNLKHGQIPIFEPGLGELVAQMTAAGRLDFSTDLAAAVKSADFIFIAVGTPARADGDIDLSYVEAAARQIGRFIPDEAIVVIKSTVVAGTARAIGQILKSAKGGRNVYVASNPEFLREGSAIDDFMKADRIVVGSDEPATAAAMRELYRPLIEMGIPFISTTTTDAELIKYAANAFLALKIGFINEVANICENAGGNVTTVAQGVGADRRIGQNFLQPGPGFGGSCFPKDTRAFAATGRRYGAPQTLIERLIEGNEERKAMLADRILAVLTEKRRSRVAILGMAFKAQTDDVRESAALTVVSALTKAGVEVRGHDPKARGPAQSVLGTEVIWHEDPYAAAHGADVVAILTEWDDYRALDLKRLADLMNGKHLFDYRNLLCPESVTRHGLFYHGIGRPLVKPPLDDRRKSAGGSHLWADVAASPI